MAKGLKETFIESLLNAGFNKEEADALASNWNNKIRPAFITLLDDMARAIKEEVERHGQPLTASTTKTEFVRAADGYQRKR